MTKRTVLVGYDGSDSADHAAEQACLLAAHIDAGVLLVFTARLDGPPYDYPLAAGAPVGDLTRYGESVLKAGKAKLGLKNVPIETEVQIGTPGETISRRAEASDVQFVVVGRSGRGVVSRLLMGSVANRLAHICPKPLLIVP